MRTPPTDQRPSGIAAVPLLPWGSHFCVFHASAAELLDALVPFLRAGLEANELCSWEVHPPLTPEEVERALGRAVPALAEHVARGQLEILASASPPQADEALERQLDRAILAGFDGVRVVRHGGDRAEARGAGRAVGTPGLNVITAISVPRAALGVVELMERVQEHPFALVRNSGRWEVLKGSGARTRHDALERSEEKLQSLFGNMSEGFAHHRIVLDASGTPCDYIFLEVNPAFERLTGLAAKDIVGKRATRILPGIEADPTGWIGKFGRVALTGEPVRFENLSAALDRWYVVSAFSSRRGYFAVAFSDVTDRIRAEHALQEANRRLKEADQRKDEFLAVLSHELRNPLAPIQNSLYILDRTAPGGDQARRSLEVIRRQAAHLARLVDDLLDVTRIARGKIDLRRARVDAREIATRTAEDFQKLMEDRGLDFRTVMPGGEVWIDADATRVSQIVANLLHNAAKFTPRGGEVTLSVHAREGKAELRVRDTGAGIEPDLLRAIFEAFVQGERTLARTEGGLGLGLALVKGIAELHGGTVHAQSAGRGEGAEVVVRLPLAAAAAAPEPPRPRFRRTSAPRRVLVVDDNVDAARSLAEIAELLGHAAEVAYDGPSAVEMARAHAPDIVLCDIGLPGMSGYDVARALRAHGKPVQLFALSGYAQPEDVRNAIAAGFDGHVAKPVGPEDIERLLD